MLDHLRDGVGRAGADVVRFAWRPARFRTQHRGSPVGNVDEVQPLVRVADEWFALQNRLFAKQSIRAVEAGEAEDDRVRTLRAKA